MQAEGPISHCLICFVCAGEMTQRLETIADLAEDWSSNLSTHMTAHKHL